MNNAILLFTSSFISVLLMGLNTQFTRDKHKAMAFTVSLFIGASQLVFFKFIPDATPWESFFWILGGAFGIVGSIISHDVWLKFFPRAPKEPHCKKAKTCRGSTHHRESNVIPSRPKEWYKGEYDEFYGESK